jgi:anaerobic ribonucleoside-triphosphate reductase activating protein
MPATEDLKPGTVGKKSHSFNYQSLTTPQMPTPEGYIRLSGPIEHDNIVNGDGLRVVIWTQGCRQSCPGCQNPETWSETAGKLVPIDEVKDILRSFKGQSGLTFCGGEPLLQAQACQQIADWARSELGWNIWSFTGLIYEKVRANGGPEWDFVRSLDALIDGPYIQSQRDLTMKFRGSRNQRILYLKNGKVTREE